MKLKKNFKNLSVLVYLIIIPHWLTGAACDSCRV